MSMKILSGQNRNQRSNKDKVLTGNVLVSIVIVNYMTRDYLSTCLKSIFKEDSIAYEVLVVDNGSNDGSTEMVEKEFPTVQLIKNRTNTGFAKANNDAIKCASGKYILILNPDTELVGTALQKLIEFMEEDADVSAVGGKVFYPDGRVQVSCGSFPSIGSACLGGQLLNIIFRKLFPNSNFFGACGITPEELDKRHEVETLLGACVILRKSVLDRVGLFDENMFMYFEECDLFHRIKKNGGKIMFIPDAAIIHHAGSSSSKNIRKAVSYYQNSLVYYFVKNHSLKKINLFKISVMISVILKFIFLLPAYIFINKKKKADLKTKIKWQWYTFLYHLRM